MGGALLGTSTGPMPPYIGAMKSRSIFFELSVECIVKPAPAENPIIPSRAVSTPHSLARLTIMSKAASASASWLDKSKRGGRGRSGGAEPAGLGVAEAKV